MSEQPSYGRSYQSEVRFQLTWRERLRALVGGQVYICTRMVVYPGAYAPPTETIKRVEWPWSVPE